MAAWQNPVPAVAPLDSNVLRLIFTSIQDWTGTVGGYGSPTTILYGNANPTNATGNNGDFYLNTATTTLFGPKATGVWPAGAALVGATGTQGAVGATGAQGPQGGTLNVDGGDPSSVYGGILPLDAGGI